MQTLLVGYFPSGYHIPDYWHVDYVPAPVTAVFVGTVHGVGRYGAVAGVGRYGAVAGVGRYGTVRSAGDIEPV